MTDFGDLLQSAEQLSAECDLASFSSHTPAGGASVGGAGGGGAGSSSAAGGGGANHHFRAAELPRVQRNLAQLVEAGQQLFT